MTQTLTDGAPARSTTNPTPTDAAGPTRRPWRGDRDPFVPLLVMLRWGCLVAALLGTGDRLGAGDRGVVVAVFLGIAHAAARTVRPVTGLADPGARPVLGARTWAVDLCVGAAAVGLSGGLTSPMLVILAVEIVTAGLCVGYVGAVVAAAVGTALVGVPALAVGIDADELETAAPMMLAAALTPAVAGYARTLFIGARSRESEATDRIEQLTEVNRLLLLLHGMAQTIPESLDLRETLESARDRLREVVPCDSVVVLVHEESTDTWSTGLAEGARSPAQWTRATLPPRLADAAHSPSAVLAPELAPGEGLADRARSGMYVALPARGRVVGLLAVEHHAPGTYGTQEQRLLAGLADSLGLAIDNARWFRRLRALGAEEERTRIARDLHDRLAQSLVFITFELDRIVRRRGPDPELERMRDDVRRAVGELRETLVQLRTTVSEHQTFEAAARELVERFERRTAIETTLDVHGDDGSIPPRVSQELLRILQEALSNVERHADATTCAISWRVDDGSCRMTVVDDGRGFENGPDRRADSFGVVGMYERADAIGASLRIASGQDGGTGTTVAVQLELHQVVA